MCLLEEENRETGADFRKAAGAAMRKLSLRRSLYVLTMRDRCVQVSA